MLREEAKNAQRAVYLGASQTSIPPCRLAAVHAHRRRTLGPYKIQTIQGPSRGRMFAAAATPLSATTMYMYLIRAARQGAQHGKAHTTAEQAHARTHQAQIQQGSAGCGSRQLCTKGGAGVKPGSMQLSVCTTAHQLRIPWPSSHTSTPHLPSRICRCASSAAAAAGRL